eukprot:529968_1
MSQQNDDETSTNNVPSVQSTNSHRSAMTPPYFAPSYYPHAYSNQQQLHHPYFNQPIQHPSSNQHNTNTNTIPFPTTLSFSFKRHSPPKSKKEQQLLQAIKRFDGMKGHDTISVQIIKTGNVESDSDDCESDNESIKKQKRNKQDKHTTDSKPKINSQALRTLLEFALKNSIKNRINKTEIKNKAHVKETESNPILEQLTKLGLTRKPATQYKFKDGVFLPPIVLFKGEIIKTKIDVNWVINDTNIQNIYTEVATEVNKIRKEFFENKEKERVEKEKKALEKSKLNSESNPSKKRKNEMEGDTPQNKKQKLDDNNNNNETNT